jgi:hypothetical protein
MVTVLSIEKSMGIIHFVVVVVVFFDTTDRRPFGMVRHDFLVVYFVFLSANVGNILESIIDHKQ